MPTDLVCSGPLYARTPQNPMGVGYCAFRLGDIEVFQLFEGAAARDMAADFFTNTGLADVEAALREAGFAPDKIPNSYTVTAVRFGGRLILFDAGFGANGGPSSGRLKETMALAGLDPADVSEIIITHCHPDHIFGLSDAEGRQVYPDIPIYVPAAELDFWGDPANLDVMPKSRVALAKRIQATLAVWPNIVRYGAGQEVLPGVQAVATYGHSAGHTSLLLSSGGKQLMVTGDVTNIPAFNMANPGWRIAADDDAATAEATRRRVLDQLATSQTICTGYHWGMPGAGRILAQAEGYALKPLEGFQPA